MSRRHPIPRIWLMTDPRMGEALLPAIRRLPKGAGVVFRHYGETDRTALYARVRRIARRRGLVLIVAGEMLPGADGRHNASGPGLRTRPAHSRHELRAAERGGVDAIFVSPIHLTRSHPGARALGRGGLTRLIAGASLPVIALGGMDVHRHRALARTGVYGWAGIDAFVRQKRNAVPT